MQWPDDFINKVICGNCLEVMKDIPDNSIDLVVTDPPYGIDGATGGQARQVDRIYHDAGFTDTPEYVGEIVIPTIHECLRVAKTVIITPGTRCLMMYPQPDDIGCMFTPASSRLSKFGFQTFHPILYYGIDPRAGKGCLPNGKIVTERSEQSAHPCPKPLSFVKWLVYKGSLNESDIILDPFLGSGTTAVAAKQLGRRYIGIDIVENYCKISVQRLAQRELFNRETI